MEEQTQAMDLKLKYSTILKNNDIHDEIAQVTLTKPNLQGQHLTSVIETARIDFENGEKPPLELFLKKRLPPIGDPGVDDYLKYTMLKEGKFLTEFARELDIFSKERTNDSSSLTSGLFPKTFYFDEDVIVMENLTKRGYSILSIPTRGQQDFEEASTSVCHLAKLHAVSLVMIDAAGGSSKFLESHPGFKEEYTTPSAKEAMSKAYEPRCQLALDVLKMSTHEEKDDKYEILKKHQGKILDDMCECIEAESIFSVVVQGDCWNNNMMFDETLKKIVLVDFQFYMVGSPSLDLSTFIFSSVKPEVRKRWQELLAVYFASLKANVESLGHPFEFKFEEFVQDFIRKSKLGFFYSLFGIIGFEAMRHHDPEKENSDDFLNKFTIMMKKWVDENPVKAQAVSISLIALISDYLLVGPL